MFTLFVVGALGSDFNYDFHVTNDEDVTPIEWNFMTKQELIDASSTATATSSCARIPALSTSPDLLCGTDQLLDLTPLGRQDADVELLHHDNYPGGSWQVVARSALRDVVF